ncbi:MAG TPA: ammonium transporter [Anaerolineae bacterium]|nr:ammonium transporter [Anaerolineae bacterium]
MNAGDTAFILVSAALVMFMTPGLALFYGGMVRSKNVLGTIMHSFIMLGIITVLWMLFGYSLAFGPDKFGIIGGLNWVGLNGVGLAPNPDYAPTIPHEAFMIFQAMFAIITPALITGAFAERMKFKSFLAFMIAWFVLVYIPVAHWVWGVGGWIRELGALDFAGGIVVHASSGAAALAAAIFIGRRKGFGSEPLIPHNLPLTIIGTGILWFGWFGFNAGSALSSGAVAANAFVTTHTAATAATVSWVIIEWLRGGKPTMLGAATGAIAGLATITPAAGFVSPSAALVIGLIAGVICYYAISLKFKLGYDDSLDVVGVHGVGGVLGTLSAGVFASAAINKVAGNGLIFGNPSLLATQAIAVLAVVGYSFILSMVVLKVIDVLLGVRVSEDEELTGLDLTQHSEVGYDLSGLSAGAGGFITPGALSTHVAPEVPEVAKDMT